MKIEIKKDKDSFVYLDKVIPNIILDIRYATKNNFTGQVVKGYEKGVAIATQKASEVLKKVNEELNLKGYNLKIFDSYRPVKAVRFFEEWSRKKEDCERIKKIYYPNFQRHALIGKYIAGGFSSHNRGSTVDLTIVNLENQKELDMGTIFDFLDEKSHTNALNIPNHCKKNRFLLQDVMERNGFQNLWKEWWHYTLIDEPFKDTYFDFDVI